MDVRFSNWLNTGDLYMGVEGDPHTLDVRLIFSLAFLAPSATKKEYTLEQAWTLQKGTLVLMGADATDPALLRRGLDEILAPGDRLVWIANPNDPVWQWSAQVFSTTNITGGRKLAKPARLTLTEDRIGYCLGFKPGCTLKLDLETAKLAITPAGSGAIAFGRGKAEPSLPVQSLELALSGTQGIQLDFGFGLPAGLGLTDAMQQLDIGMRFARADEDGDWSVRFPVFQPHELHPGLSVLAKVTPQHMLDREQTVLSASTVDTSPERFVTYYRTIIGRTIQFETGLMQFSFAAQVPQEEQPSRLTLSLEGTFEVHIGGREVEQDSREDAAEIVRNDCIALGVSGTEYIRLPEDPGLIEVRLEAGHPAFSADDEAPLGHATTSSWVSIRPANELSYFAQPEGGGTLFDASHLDGTVKVPMLPYLPLPAGKLEKDVAAPWMPWVPLAGLKASEAEDGLTLEVLALAPARKAVIGTEQRRAVLEGRDLPLLPLQEDLEDDDLTTGITPKGLVAGFRTPPGGTTKWETVEIALLQDPNEGKVQFAGTEGIDEPLRSALLTNQQFIVATNPESIRKYFSDPADNRLKIEEWEFLLEPDKWADHGTMLIIKNAEAALGELAADLGSWTDAAIFNTRPATAQKELLRIIAEAETLHGDMAARLPEKSGETDFAYFVDQVVNSPDWNGFLFLNAQIGELPPELDGLRAGIQQDRFFAHHVGVTQTAFKKIEELKGRSSAVFGLIRYADTSPGFGSGSGFAFRVEDLGVLFQNAEIKAFRSQLAFHAAKLFGRRPKTDDGTPPVIRMEGVRQLRGNDYSYAFSTQEKMTLGLGDGPLREIELAQGSFETVSSEDAQDNGKSKDITSRFRFDGDLKFGDVGGDLIAEFDIYSFNRLHFSDLTVELAFNTGQPTKRAFTTTLVPVQLSESLSEARERSLFEGMPVKLSRMLDWTGGKTGEQGFMTVDLGVATKPLQTEWFGVELILDLGTLSDIAGSAGAQASLLIAWGPESGQELVGLKLPGSASSSAELSLLGVLKLSIYSLQLRQSEKNWALLLRGMKLGVFGKSLPPDGTFDFYLFGNPNPEGSADSLGWYGAYVAEQKKKKEEEDADRIGRLKTLPPPRRASRRANFTPAGLPHQAITIRRMPSISSRPDGTNGEGEGE